MRGLLIIVAALWLLTAGVVALALRDELPAAAAAPTDVTVLKVGDEVRVDGAPIGCRVTRIEGRISFDCRRAGRLAGTYGTLLSERKAMVARFRSQKTAKVVFSATHEGRAHECQDAHRSRR